MLTVLTSRSAVLVAAAGLGSLLASSALATPFVRAVVVCPIDPVPGIPNPAMRFANSANLPTVLDNQGRVAFASVFSGAGLPTGSGVFSEAFVAAGGVLSPVAFQGGVAPGTTGANVGMLFGFLGSRAVVLSENGRVGFSSQIDPPAAPTGGPWGVFAQEGSGGPGGTGLVGAAIGGQAAPTLPAGTWTMNTDVRVSMSRDGVLAFKSPFQSGTGYTGLFRGAPTAVAMCARTLGPSETTGYLTFSDPQYSDGSGYGLTLNYRLPVGDRTGFWAGSCGGLASLVAPGVVVPVSAGLPPGTSFGTIQNVAACGNLRRAFIASLSGPDITGANSDALFVIEPSGVMATVARRGEQVPGLAPGTFWSSFTSGNVVGPLVSNAGTVAWISSINGPAVNLDTNRVIVMRFVDGSLRIVARQGSPMPGFPATTTHQLGNNLALNALGEAAFTSSTSASAPPARSGVVVYSTDSAGEPSILIESGTVMPLRQGLTARLSNFGGPLPSGGDDGLARNWNDRGQLAVRANYVNTANINGQGVVLLVVGRACGLSDVAGPGQSPTPDNQLTADDIIVFLNRFFASDWRADVAGPGQTTTPDGQFTADDIIVFLNRFFAGC